MAIIQTDSVHYESIAEKIREKLGVETRYKPAEMPNGLDDVYEAGKKAADDAFWDVVQVDGTRESYMCAFISWGCEYIHPKHKVVPKTADSRNQTFCSSKSLKRVEKEYFDFSQCPKGTTVQSGWYYTFYQCPDLEVVEDVGINNAYSFNSTFSSSPKIHTIECIYPDENTTFSDTFNWCDALVYLRVNGTIGKNGFNVRYSKKLDKESHISVFNAFSTTATISATFSKVAVDKAFETTEGANDGSTSAEWIALVGTRPNVTILLA